MERVVLFLVAATAACSRPTPSPSEPGSQRVEPVDEAAAEPSPTALQPSLSPGVADAVRRALDERYQPAPSADPFEAWTNEFISWSAKEKRPVNDAALLALDEAYRGATDDPARQVVVHATAEFYEALANEMNGYREQVRAQMSDGGHAPDIASAYWKEAARYYQLCAELPGSQAETCRAGHARAQAALAE